MCIFSSAGVHLILDVDGYFPVGTSYHSIDPARLLDTRPGFATIDGQFVGAGIRPAGTVTELPVAGRAGVPVGASTVLNVTVTGATQSGFVTVYECGISPPLASNVNYTPNTMSAVAVIAKVGTDGKVCILNSGATDIVVDVKRLPHELIHIVPYNRGPCHTVARQCFATSACFATQARLALSDGVAAESGPRRCRSIVAA